jgi:hemerythrin-like domain-containing protein
MDDLIRELKNTDPSDPDFDDKFQELMEGAEEHFDEEEAEMFPQAQILGGELDELGIQIRQEKERARI